MLAELICRRLCTGGGLCGGLPVWERLMIAINHDFHVHTSGVLLRQLALSETDMASVARGKAQ